MNKLWDPFSPDPTNPYPMYDRLRANSPVHRSQSGDYVLTRYSDIKAILLNNQGDFRSGNRLEWITRQVKYLENKDEDLNAILDAMNNFLVMMNPPEHTALRNTVTAAWDNREVDQIIDENINELLGSFDGPVVDFVKYFAEPLPVMTIARIMGLPLKDYHELKKMATGMLRCLDVYLSLKQLIEIDEHARQFIAYLNDYLDFREANLSNDLVSKIIQQHKINGVAFERRKMISTCMFLFMAGEETTVNLIGTGLLAILKHPDQKTAILTDNNLLENAVDECLRYESPVQLLGRIANKDMELGGVQLKKNDTLTLAIGAANRDPEEFTDPQSFNIRRNARKHLAFGAGAHFCLGSWLAMKQWKMAIRSVLNRFPSLAISEAPAWNNMLSVRGLRSLKLSIT